MKAPRITELDALRGIAAFSVMIYHFTAAYLYLYSIGRFENFTMHAVPTFSFGVGRLGVDLFFIISGFVIFLTLVDAKKPMDFVVSRFSRLYPAYWAALFINLFLVIGQVNPMQFLVNSTMLSAWFNTPYVMQIAWTLTVELSFYVCMFLLFTTNKLKHIEPIGLAWLCMMALNERLGPLWHMQLPWIMQQSRLLVYGNLFFAGILFYKIKFEGMTWQRNACLVLCWLTQFLVAREYFPSPEVVLVFFAVFYLLCFDKLPILRHKIFTFFGTISYSLYLIHENFGDKILRLMDRPGSYFYVNLLVAVSGSIALASVITYLIERPSMKWIREIYKHERYDRHLLAIYALKHKSIKTSLPRC